MFWKNYCLLFPLSSSFRLEDEEEIEFDWEVKMRRNTDFARKILNLMMMRMIMKMISLPCLSLILIFDWESLLLVIEVYAFDLSHLSAFELRFIVSNMLISLYLSLCNVSFKFSFNVPKACALVRRALNNYKCS